MWRRAGAAPACQKPYRHVPRVLLCMPACIVQQVHPATHKPGMPGCSISPACFPFKQEAGRGATWGPLCAAPRVGLTPASRTGRPGAHVLARQAHVQPCPTTPRRRAAAPGPPRVQTCQGRAQGHSTTTTHVSGRHHEAGQQVGRLFVDERLHALLAVDKQLAILDLGGTGGRTAGGQGWGGVGRGRGGGGLSQARCRAPRQRRCRCQWWVAMAMWRQ